MLSNSKFSMSLFSLINLSHFSLRAENCKHTASCNIAANKDRPLSEQVHYQACVHVFVLTASAAARRSPAPGRHCARSPAPRCSSTAARCLSPVLSWRQWARPRDPSARRSPRPPRACAPAVPADCNTSLSVSGGVFTRDDASQNKTRTPRPYILVYRTTKNLFWKFLGCMLTLYRNLFQSNFLTFLQFVLSFRLFASILLLVPLAEQGCP